MKKYSDRALTVIKLKKKSIRFNDLFRNKEQIMNTQSPEQNVRKDNTNLKRLDSSRCKKCQKIYNKKLKM